MKPYRIVLALLFCLIAAGAAGQQWVYPQEIFLADQAANCLLQRNATGMCQCSATSSLDLDNWGSGAATARQTLLANGAGGVLWGEVERGIVWSYGQVKISTGGGAAADYILLTTMNTANEVMAYIDFNGNQWPTGLVDIVRLWASKAGAGCGNPSLEIYNLTDTQSLGTVDLDQAGLQEYAFALANVPVDHVLIQLRATTPNNCNATIRAISWMRYR